MAEEKPNTCFKSGLLTKVIHLLKNEKFTPGGIPLMDISLQFYLKYGIYLNTKDYNFKSLYQMFEELSEKSKKSIVLFKHNTNTLKSDRIFLDVDAYDRWIKEYKDKRNIKFLEYLIQPFLPKDIPLQHNQNGNLIPKPFLPKEAFNPLHIICFRVEIVEVLNSSQIIIRLLQNRVNYNKLKQSLRFYNGSEEQTDPYILPKELALMGYMCVAKNPKDWDNWQRVQIVDVDGEYVTLFAIDFGNYFREDRKELRLIKTELLSFPPQITTVRLAGVMPNTYINNGYRWTKESTNYLNSLIQKYKNNIQCIFLESLAENYYSVFLQSTTNVEVEGESKPFPIYFHEKLIQNGFGIMSSHYGTEETLSETIEEPLLMIKYEPDFGDYESPTIPLENFSPIKKEKCDNNEKSDPQSVAQQSTKEVTQNLIDYKRLFFTSDKFIDTKINSYFKKQDFPFTEHKYFNEDMLDMKFPCFQLKYFKETNEESAEIKPKYFNGDQIEESAPIRYKYYSSSSDQNSDYGKSKYLNSNLSETSTQAKYYVSDSPPLVYHKYFRTEGL